MPIEVAGVTTEQIEAEIGVGVVAPHTYGSASSRGKAWELMASSSANFCRKTLTALTGRVLVVPTARPWAAWLTVSLGRRWPVCCHSTPHSCRAREC
jgi:hypothetical protein